jgi:bifunctional pyridoxal-dependent enzyme with beta-cystathionase and maltose regulon repressor activities
MDYWAGHLVAGREVERDREAEFEAVGSVAELSTRVAQSLLQLEQDLKTADPPAPLRHQPDPWAQGPDRPLTQGAALLHLYEELAQHHGQMQVLRDVLLPAPAPAEDSTPGADPFNDLPLSWLRSKRAVKWHRPGPELLPAWVADMDFRPAPAIRAALLGALERGDLGYPDWPENPLAAAFSTRMQNRYGWDPDRTHVRGITDLIQAVQIVVALVSEPGQAIVAHTPNYPPFLATISRMDRQLIAAPMLADGDGWTWDHQALEASVRGAQARVLLLVNPHNPTGRAFRRGELEQLADLAERHDLTVISDEIHAELIHHPHRHLPFASLGPRTAARTITITSATKAFNIAGLRAAVAHVGPAAVRAGWDASPPDRHGAINVLGVEATLAAWTEGHDWLRDLNAHLLGQRDHLAARIPELTGLSLRPPEAGYLAWLDCGGAELPIDPAAWFRAHAGVQVSPGPDYGPGNERRLRLNFATSRTMLDEILDRMSRALNERD